MSGSGSPPSRLPLSIGDGWSLLDGTRLRWQGAGNLLLALYCFFGAGGPGGVVFGSLFVLLAVATWSLTSFGNKYWYSIAPTGQIIAGIGSAIGIVVLYMTFGIFFLIIWIISLFA